MTNIQVRYFYGFHNLPFPLPDVPIAKSKQHTLGTH